MGTLPTPEKTWQYAHIAATPTGSVTGDAARAVWGMKEALKAFALQPWTVAGSNDGATAGMDAVDRWDAYTDITFTGVAGASWIVLQAPSGWGGAQILIYSTNGGTWNTLFYMKISPSGAFTGGSTTTLPTATDSDTLVTNVGAGGDFFNFSGFPTGVQVACHVMHSTDGQNTRAFFCIQGVCTGFWAVETAGGAGALWTPARFYGRGPFQNVQPTTNALVWQIGQNWMRAKSPLASLGLGALGYLNAIHDMNFVTNIYSSFTVANEISGEYPLWPIGLYGNPTYITGLRGQAGYLKDWWITVNSVNAGDGIPGDASKQFMSFGSGIVVPWDGTTPVIG